MAQDSHRRKSELSREMSMGQFLEQRSDVWAMGCALLGQSFLPLLPRPPPWAGSQCLGLWPQILSSFLISTPLTQLKHVLRISMCCPHSHVDAATSAVHVSSMLAPPTASDPTQRIQQSSSSSQQIPWCHL